MKFSLEQIKNVLNTKGYRFFDGNKSYNINIIGVRKTKDEALNFFDDELYLIYRDDNLKMITKRYPITTDPGLYYLVNRPLNPYGTAILVPGQYLSAYKIGIHSNYEAVVQYKRVPVYRDNDRDGQIDCDPETIRNEVVGLNIHRSNPYHSTSYVNKYSAGCQVFQNPNDFDEFMSICRKSKSIFGNSFTYTLLTEDDFIQEDKFSIPNLTVKKIDFPGNQYVKERSEKSIFVIHHSAGWDSATRMYNTWAKDTRGRVSTAYGIVDNGDIYQGFDIQYWGYALGLHNEPHDKIYPYNTLEHDRILNSKSIQVEICNWGGLDEKNGSLYAWPAKYYDNWSDEYKVEESKTFHYPTGYRGYHYFERYTDDEIEALRKLILYLHEVEGIPLDYHENMWDRNTDALSGKPGIWSHTSYRTDKSDAHPQTELVQMLKGLKSDV